MSKALRSTACTAVLAALSLGAAWSAAASPQSLEDWRARLANHPVLGKLVMVVNKDHEPVTILVNEPQPRTRQGFETPVTDSHGPWFVAMRRLFGRRYAEPFNLTRREGRELDPIVILWQLSDYAPYAKAVKDPGCFNAEGAHFDPELGAVVSFEYGAMNADGRNHPRGSRRQARSR